MAQAPPVPALRMRGVAKSFGAVAALAGVDLEVLDGEVHALVGENGAGKSTLMKVLAGVHRPDAGAIEVRGRKFAPSSPVDALRRGISMIYQELNLAPHLSVEQNIMLGRERARLGFVERKRMRGAVESALATLGLEVSPTTLVASLGPASRQLVEIARALVGDVRVLVLDEPTSSLSRHDTQRLFGVVRTLQGKGVAVVYISHFLEEVQQLCDRYTVLRDGRTVSTGHIKDVTIEVLVERMAGREIDDVYPRAAHASAEVVLRAEHVAGERLPTDASCALRAGEVLGIAGLVGAGRTEFLRAMFGLDRVLGGRISVLRGAPLVAEPLGRSPRTALDAGVGLVSEDRKNEGLALGMSIMENMTLSALGPLTRWGWIRRGRQRDSAQRWIERLAIRCHDPRQSVGSLSGGNQQKVALARLLHQDVDVLMLDEPTRGIDVASKVEVYRFLDELARAGKAILVVSSYLPELLGICDRIAVMHRGVLGPARPRAEWTEASLLDEATRGATE